MANQLLKQLFCRHRRWHKNPLPGALTFGTTRFVCLSCGKQKYFDPMDYPINHPVKTQP